MLKSMAHKKKISIITCKSKAMDQEKYQQKK